MRKTWLAIRASVAGILISVGLLTSWLALPQSVAACSCYSSDLKAMAKLPGSVIFSGTIQATDAANLEVVVDRWFHGAGSEPIVHLDPGGFGIQSSACQVAPPPAGSRWLFAGYRWPDRDLVQISLCSLRGDLSTADGRALLTAAVKTFPNAIVPPPATGLPSSAPPAAPASSAPVAAPTAVIASVPPTSIDGVPGTLAAVGLVLVVAGLAVVVVVIARRRLPS